MTMGAAIGRKKLAKIESFGQMPDGTAVQRIALAGGGLSAHILTLGAIVQDVRLKGHAAPLVLGFDSLSAYLAHSPYFGAIAGRYANRIAGGRLTLDNHSYQLDRNQDETHHLHGGEKGTSEQVWTLAEAGVDFAVLTLDLADGEMGYPGRLAIRCTYRLGPEGRLRVTLEATSDKVTVCNLTQHSYFNLCDGGLSDLSGHLIEIAADRYVPVDDTGIPTNGAVPVADTGFDLRGFSKMMPEAENGPFGYDHNFCLADARRAVRLVAEAYCPASEIGLAVETTEPGLQFYTGFKIKPAVPGLTGSPYRPFAGFCLEPQIWPDAPNRSDFPSARLDPGDAYRHETIYRFYKGVKRVKSAL